MTIIKSNATSLFVQEYPGAAHTYLGDIDGDCFNLDSIPNPKGSVDPIHCTDANGKIEVVGVTRGGRDLVSFSTESFLKTSVGELERLAQKNCPFVFHALQRCGGKAGIFSNWIRAESLAELYFTDSPIGNVRQRDATDPMTHGSELTARSPRWDRWEISNAQVTTSETMDANTIHSFVIESCGGICGAQADVCDVMVIGCDATGAATANVLRSTDGGATWAATAADPFAGIAENITAIRMFQVGSATVRILAARNTDAGNPGEVSYSDDNGATWTEVAYGAVNGEYVEGHHGLFVLDENNLWLCTDQGNVYKSTTGGTAWTLQTSSATASGGNDLWGLFFIDQNIGVAVGDADTVIYTIDGGTNWVAGTATGGANDLRSVTVFGRYRWLVTDASGNVYQTWNGSTAWVEMTDFTGTGTGSILSHMFVTELHGYMTHTDAGGDGHILETIDGGRSWRRVPGATEAGVAAAGLNAIHVCALNAVKAVGDDDGATAIIISAGSV